MKKWGWWIVAGLFTLFIFSNSLATGSQSGHLSLTIAQAIHQFLMNISIQIDLEFLHIFIRKLAHFSEYALLGVLFTLAFHFQPLSWLSFKYHKLIYFLIPVIDETLQLFSPGRSCQVTDMLIDSCGMITGILITTLLLALILRKKRRT